MIKNILSYKAIFLGPLITGHFLYINYSSNKKELLVKDKYTYVKAGFTHFMIIDNNDVHYNIHNSFYILFASLFLQERGISRWHSSAWDSYYCQTLPWCKIPEGGGNTFRF